MLFKLPIFKAMILRILLLTTNLLVCTLVAGSKVNFEPQDTLPGTDPLEWNLSPDEISFKMMEGAHRFIDREIMKSVEERQKL